jgi:SAM-dependent methyltransferase
VDYCGAGLGGGCEAHFLRAAPPAGNASTRERLKTVGETMPENRKPMYDVYQEYYERVGRSAAFSLYCERVFGVDLSQDGFSDMQQLDCMIALLGIGETDLCLDVGCGNGRIARYVTLKTGAAVEGLDYSERAITSAQAMASLDRRLSFISQDINELKLEKGKYSVIYLIDSIYFSNDFGSTLQALGESLQAGGRLALFYSEFVFDPARQIRKLAGKETALYHAIDGLGWPCEIHDFTGDLYELMKQKKRIGNELKDQFAREQNEWLFAHIDKESVPEDMSLADFERFTNRYLYCIRKVDGAELASHCGAGMGG